MKALYKCSPFTIYHNKWQKHLQFLQKENSKNKAAVVSTRLCGKYGQTQPLDYIFN